MAQQVKNPLAMQELQETRVWSLGQEDPLDPIKELRSQKTDGALKKNKYAKFLGKS